MPIIRRRVDELYHEEYKYCDELEKDIERKYGNCVDVAFYITNCEPCVSAKVFINDQIYEIKISKIQKKKISMVPLVVMEFTNNKLKLSRY